MDDNEINRKVLTRFFQKYIGVVPDSVCDGDEAVEKVVHENRTGSEPYEVVLTDINMPRMDGITATAAILKELGRESPRTPD